MRISASKLLAVTFLLSVTAARADDFRVSSSNRINVLLEQQEQDIGQLRAELASLRSELAGAVKAPEGGTTNCNQPSANAAGGSCVNGCSGASCCKTTGGCNNGCYDSCCDPLAYQSGFGWFAYGETFIVKPFSTFGTASQGDFNYTATPRITVGGVAGSGFGVRARYWTFNDFADTNNIFFVGNVFRNQIQTHVVDVEATDRIQLRKWIFTGSLGLRYVSFLDRFTDPSGAFVAPGGLFFRDKTESWGIVGGLNFVRPFAYRWSFYGNARYSILTGKTGYAYNIAPVSLTIHSTTQSITELGAGLQFNHRLRNGMNLVARSGYEAQYWNGFGDIGIVSLGQTTSFAGLTLGAGVNY